MLLLFPRSSLRYVSLNGKVCYLEKIVPDRGIRRTNKTDSSKANLSAHSAWEVGEQEGSKTEGCSSKKRANFHLEVLSIKLGNRGHSLRAKRITSDTKQ